MYPNSSPACLCELLYDILHTSYIVFVMAEFNISLISASSNVFICLCLSVSLPVSFPLNFSHFLIQCTATIVIMCIGETHNLINYVSFINYLSYGVTIAGLLYYRWKKPNLYRPIKVSLKQTPTQKIRCFFMCRLRSHWCTKEKSFQLYSVFNSTDSVVYCIL